VAAGWSLSGAESIAKAVRARPVSEWCWCFCVWSDLRAGRLGSGDVGGVIGACMYYCLCIFCGGGGR
jgi:hypothetical protein